MQRSKEASGLLLLRMDHPEVTSSLERSEDMSGGKFAAVNFNKMGGGQQNNTRKVVVKQAASHETSPLALSGAKADGAGV